MRKFAKMSLVAAVAVAGLSSTLSAQPLEEAIKGVDVSGMLRYRYDDTATETKPAAGASTKASNQNNNYRLDVNVKSKVNDAVTANVTVALGNDGAGVNLGETAASNNGVATGNIATEAGATLYVKNANFAANIAGATVIAGKQSIPGPFVDNSVDDISRGTGAVALIPVGPVTLAAGYFSQHSVTSTNVDVAAHLAQTNATELAVLGNVAGVSFDAWHANVSDTLNALSVGVKTTVAGVTLDARHSTLNMRKAYDALGLAATVDGKSSLTKLVASAKVGPATLIVGGATTGKANGTNYNRIAIDTDNDAAVDFKVFQASAGAFADATALLVGASMEVMPAVTADVRYVTLGAKENNAVGAKDVDASELLFMATYAMSKNFAVHARYSMLDIDRDATSTVNSSDTETTKGRLELKYTF